VVEKDEFYHSVPVAIDSTNRPPMCQEQKKNQNFTKLISMLEA
jgi:hypothetical protein